MAVVEAWRHFWAQRSRARLWLAAVCVVAALIAVGWVYLPGEWLEQVSAAIQAASAYLVSFGGRSWLFAAGGVLVACALLLVVLPRRRPRVYEELRPSAIAPVSVYVDAENQATTPDNARALYRAVREYLKGLRSEHQDMRADLLYFTDGPRVANASLERPNDKKALERWKAYRALYRFGFRPVHVSHKPVGKSAAENVVDVELALCAYRRALLGPPHQTIILVANDGDYYPLIYRLLALEHAVQVWGTTLAEGYKDLEESVGIRTRLFGVPEESPKKPGGKVLPKKSPEKALPTDATPRLMPQVPPVNAATIGILTDVITRTLRAVEEVSQPGQTAGQRFELLRGKVSRDNDIPLRMGITSKTRLAVWLWLLTTLGALVGDTTTKPLVAGPDQAPSAAEKLERLLAEVAAVARAMASETPGSHEVSVRTVWQWLCQHAQGSAEVNLAGVQAALRVVVPAHIEHYALTLCRCARSLGLLQFKETSPGSIEVTLHVRPAREAATDVDGQGIPAQEGTADMERVASLPAQSEE